MFRNEKKRTYKIIAEKSLIVQYYAGDIGIDDIIYLQKVISNELSYSPAFDIVVDFSHATFY